VRRRSWPPGTAPREPAVSGCTAQAGRLAWPVPRKPASAGRSEPVVSHGRCRATQALSGAAQAGRLRGPRCASQVRTAVSGTPRRVGRPVSDRPLRTAHEPREYAGAWPSYRVMTTGSTTPQSLMGPPHPPTPRAMTNPPTSPWRQRLANSSHPPSTTVTHHRRHTRRTRRAHPGSGRIITCPPSPAPTYAAHRRPPAASRQRQRQRQRPNARRPPTPPRDTTRASAPPPPPTPEPTRSSTPP
jgi:hypothetical protein